MAFLPQPTLPKTSHPPPQLRVSIRAAADGVISVSRRRRVYEFLSATIGTTSTPLSDTKPTPAATPASNGVPTASADPAKVRDDLVTRMKEREAAIAADAAEKASLWQAELAALRTPPVEVPEVVPEPVEEEEIEVGPVPSYYPSRSRDTAELFGADDVVPLSQPSPTAARAAPFALYASYAPPGQPVSKPVAPSVPTAPGAAPVTPEPSQTRSVSASAVSELYAPQTNREEQDDGVGPTERIREMVEDVREVIEDVVESVRDTAEDVVDEVRDTVEDVVENVIEAITPTVEETAAKEAPDTEKLPEAKKAPQVKKAPEAKKAGEAKKAPETKKAPEARKVREPEKAPKPLETNEDRSIGEVILDAIVEGVPTPEPEQKKPTVDKSALIELIDTGKVKNLTVTKLRRLLSQNGLKTSGRKAELIARLTSFAKAK